MDYHAPGRHLLLDGVFTTAYMYTRQRETREIPGMQPSWWRTGNSTPTRSRSGLLPRSMGGGTPWTHLQLRMVADSAPMHRRSSARLRSALSAKGGGAAPMLVAPAGKFFGVTGRHRYPCGYRGGNAISPPCSTSRYRGSSFGSSAPSKRHRTSTPRVTL